MKRFSRIKETVNEYSKLRLCFTFAADENPSSDLHGAALIISLGIHDVRSNRPRFEGFAYVLTDRRRDLERGQERLWQLGWQEIANNNPGQLPQV
jgi:hypothetical protein